MTADDANFTKQIVASLLEKAEASSPADQEQLKNAALAVDERSKWQLIHEWPGLFRLQRKPDGTMVAEPDSALAERLRRLKQGVLPNEHLLDAAMHAFEAILGFSTLPPEDEPSSADIPQPTSGVSNAIDIHRAAMRLYRETVGFRLLRKALQETLGPRIRALFEGSRDGQVVAAKQLKKDLGKAIDHFSQHQSAAALVHGNKLKTTETLAVEPIAVHVIEAARQLVEQHQKLPTKLAVREKLETMLPETADISISTWNRLLKDTGLAALPRDKPWRR